MNIATKKNIQKRCISTGTLMNTRSMVRFVVGPDGNVVPDVFYKLPGKGIWVGSKKKSLETAIKQNLFSSSICRPVEVDQNLTGTVEVFIIRKLTNLISIARKAKQAVFGFEKVRSQLELKNARLLIQASDGSSREKSRLRPPAGKNSLINCLTMNELGLAFGRENVIHATIMNGGLYKEISLEALRIEGIREMNSCQSIQKDEHTYE
ncbi:MAG: RNA-binding protein [Paracoccaceae bacterium]